MNVKLRAHADRWGKTILFSHRREEPSSERLIKWTVNSLLVFDI